MQWIQNQFSESSPWDSAPQVSEDREQPSIQPILHVTPRQDEELVGVIVTICSGASYDPLFNQVPQLAGEGKRVATYSVSATSLPYIAAELSGDPDQVSCASCLQQNLTHLIRDVQAVQPDSVVFNYECCDGCTGEHFPNSAIVLDLVKRLLDRGHMVMFSDFSLKALIKDWKEDLLGPNPFVKVTEFSNKFVLRFDPSVLSRCPSAQLQKLGELASNGKTELHAMPGTIAFSVRWQKADCSAYNCQVLTVMTEFDGQRASPMQGEGCEVGGHRGLAGHVLLTYPSGGKLLASAGHWVELSRLDVSEAKLFEVAASYGAAFQDEVQKSMASCSSAAERHASVQHYSCQMVQQASPCSYSLPPQRQMKSAPAKVC
jgi:hypothetical protein